MNPGIGPLEGHQQQGMFFEVIPFLIPADFAPATSFQGVRLPAPGPGGLSRRWSLQGRGPGRGCPLAPEAAAPGAHGAGAGEFESRLWTEGTRGVGNENRPRPPTVFCWFGVFFTDESDQDSARNGGC